MTEFLLAVVYLILAGGIYKHGMALDLRRDCMVVLALLWPLVIVTAILSGYDMKKGG